VIVLDTHALLWWIDAPERLSEPALEAIEQGTRLGVSAMSAWELATLAARGHIDLDRDIGAWISQGLATHNIEAIEPTIEIAVAAGSLDIKRFPGDPGDRLIYATARTLGATLITRDAAIRAYDPAATLW
jgi:PIN domain nuclease of toxin-antitoxin system